MNVLITGVSGYLGRSLLDHLLKKGVKVIGTDTAPIDINSPDFIFEQADIRDKDKHVEILKKHNISHVFHFAFILGEVKNQKKALSVNIGGTRSILKAVDEVKSVKRIIFAGSVSAYGARKTNRLYIKEQHPLRASTLKYGINKRLMEETVAKIIPKLRKDLELVMLRVCTIVGPTARDGGAVDSFLAVPFGASIIGHDCPIQFIHEHDLLNIFDKALEKEKFSGVYNVSPRQTVTVKQLCKKLKKRCLPIPYSVLYAAFYLLFRIKPELEISENSVSYLAYPIIVDCTKIEKDLGIEFRYSSLQAFISCVNDLRKK
ncbi:NAD-dependent epimerase/dehydratase family protein [Nanoarchaeota archaeon]